MYRRGSLSILESPARLILFPSDFIFSRSVSSSSQSLGLNFFTLRKTSSCVEVIGKPISKLTRPHCKVYRTWEPGQTAQLQLFRCLNTRPSLCVVPETRGSSRLEEQVPFSGCSCILLFVEDR